MKKTTVFLSFSTEIEELLIGNQLDIETMLIDEGIVAAMSHQPNPKNISTSFQDKDLVLALTILASSTAIVAVGSTVTKIINAISRKPVLIEVEEFEELRDAKGDILLDTFGRVMYKTVKTYKMVEPRKEENKTSLTLDGSTSGLMFTFSTEDKQLD